MEEPVVENEKNVAPEQQVGEEAVVEDNNKDEAVKEPEEKEPEDKVRFLISNVAKWIRRTFQFTL